jgi:sugar phosphate isomerase/epimerase
VNVAINLYTVRDLDEPLSDVLRRVADAGYEGVEFAGIGGADPEGVRERLDELGLAVAGAHVPCEELEEGFEATVERYRALGCARLVVPYLDEGAFGSLEAVDETARRLDALGERLADRGFELHYHNHDHEFVELEGTTGFEAFAERSSVGLELDLGWIEAAGANPVGLLERYADRVSLVHCKDTRSGTPVELGDGDLARGSCLDAARRTDVEWLVYEHDAPDDPVESLEAGARTLRGRS